MSETEQLAYARYQDDLRYQASRDYSWSNKMSVLHSVYADVLDPEGKEYLNRQQVP